jgi:hypothetical protein
LGWSFGLALAVSLVVYDPNQARRQLLKECYDLAALQLTADEHVVVSIDAVQLERPTSQCRDQLWREQRAFDAGVNCDDDKRTLKGVRRVKTC